MPSDAPRFRAYWERIENCSVLTMSRADWTGLRATAGTPVQISVDHTPIAGVARRASVVQALARQPSLATGEITVVRFDARDAPTPYNVDRYTVWVDVLAHPSLHALISGASTQFNDNFRRFAADTVFLIKQNPGPDHWLPTIPGSATTVVGTGSDSDGRAV